MILTTHAITGAAVASVIPSHPVLGFVAGFASHFVLDAIPHWDYELRSAKRNPDNPLREEILLNKDFVFDFIKMGCDALFGIAVALLLFSNFSIFTSFNLSIFQSSAIWGAVGALVPDALQFVYLKWKHEPMISLQKFHVIWVHSKVSLDDRPALGITLQMILILAFVVIFKFVF